jgi:hypothetical protein
VGESDEHVFLLDQRQCVLLRVPKRVADGAGLPEKTTMGVEVRKGALVGCAAASTESL